MHSMLTMKKRRKKENKWRKHRWKKAWKMSKSDSYIRVYIFKRMQLIPSKSL